VDSFEANWLLELEPTLDTSLHLGSSNHKLFIYLFIFIYFKIFFRGRLNQLMLPPKWCHVDLALICHFLVLDPHLKAIGLIYGSHPIGLLYFIGPWKVALIVDVDDGDDDVLMLLMIILWMMMMMMMMMMMLLLWKNMIQSVLVELGIWNTNSRQLTVCFALVDGEEICR